MKLRLLFLMVLAAFLYFAIPTIVRYFQTGGEYVPITLRPDTSSIMLDEHFYYANLAGHILHRGTFYGDDLYELRDLQLYHPIVGVSSALPFLKIFGDEWGWWLAKYLYSALAILMLQFLLRPISPSPWVRFTIALGVCLFAFSPRLSLLLVDGSYLHPFTLTRFPNPSFSFLLFICALLLLSRALLNGRTHDWVGAGIMGGVLFHAYYYYSLTFIATLGLLALWPRNDKVFSLPPSR